MFNKGKITWEAKYIFAPTKIFHRHRMNTDNFLLSGLLKAAKASLFFLAKLAHEAAGPTYHTAEPNRFCALEARNN